MKKSIGILGGMGPMATADLYIKILAMTRADRDCDHIRIYIDSDGQIPDRTAAILYGGEDPVPEMTCALRNLEKCGADCVLLPCNTAHCFLPRLQALTDTPILDMTRIAARRCRELFPGRRPAILGTRGLLATGLYARAMAEEGLDCLIPNDEEQGRLMHLIYDVVKASLPMEPEKETWRSLLEGLRARGAEVFLLACTELPILANTLELEGPFLDPTEELAREAILYCGYELKD